MDYLIGAGAILEAGEQASMTLATLHAQVDPGLSQRVRVAAIDFEGAGMAALRRLLVVGAGWNAAHFSPLAEQLRTRGECSLADVLQIFASRADCREVHLFAHWLPDEATCTQLAQAGISLLVHPLESIRAASLVSGQRVRRYGPKPAA